MYTKTQIHFYRFSMQTLFSLTLSEALLIQPLTAYLSHRALSDIYMRGTSLLFMKPCDSSI